MSTFDHLVKGASASTVAGVAGAIDWAKAPDVWKALISKIRVRTQKWSIATPQQIATAGGGHTIGTALPVRSAHRGAALAPQPYDALNPPVMTQVQHCWYDYAASAPTQNSLLGHTDAWIELTLSGGEGATRILFDYMNNVFLVSEHYDAQYQIVNIV